MGSKSTSRQFPGFSRLYRVRDPFKGNPFRGDPKFEDHGSFSLTRAEVKPGSPIRIEWYMGRNVPTDIIWASVVPVAINSRVLAVLLESGLSGWTTYPVEVYDKKGAFIEGYTGLAVTGRCGPVDESKSLTVLKQFPARVSPIQRGYYFDPDTWDGSDFFMPSPEMDGRFFASAAARDALLRAKVKNIEFIPLDEVEYDRLPSSS